MLGDAQPGDIPMQNPMFGGNPFAMNQPFGMPRPAAPMDGGFNVDDLVKRIDAKIAELEEEERKEKEAQEKSNLQVERVMS